MGQTLLNKIIEVKVDGDYITKDNRIAGVRGEANVTGLRIILAPSWEAFSAEVTFWDARGENPVVRSLTFKELEEMVDESRIYLIPIPAEPMAEAGMMTFVIDGYIGKRRKRSVSDKLEVKDAPITDNAGEPTDPTPTQAAQLQVQIDEILDTINNAVESADLAEASEKAAANSAESAKESADTATKKAEEAATASGNAETYARQAQEAVGKTSHIGDNGNWYAWNSSKGAFYDTGVKAQSGSTVYVGDNPPDEADVWIDPDGDGGVDITTIEDMQTALAGKMDGYTVLARDADLDNLEDGWYYLPSGHNSFDEVLGHDYPHTLYQTSSGNHQEDGIKEYETQITMCAKSIMWRGVGGVSTGFNPWQKLSLDVIDNLDSSDTTSALSANQGRVLDQKKEDLLNKVTEITESSTDIQYPSALAVYNLVATEIGDIETLLGGI